MGHLIRCLSLAKILESYFYICFLLDKFDEQIDFLITSEGFKCYYIAAENEEQYQEHSFFASAEVIVLDGYNFKSDYQKIIKEKGKMLVCIDDIHAFHFYADAIINVADSVSEKDYSAESYTRYFLGSNYALLRPPFLISSLKPAHTIECINDLFLSMGGADHNNVTLKVLKAIRKMNVSNKVHVVIGAVNVHESELQEYIKTNFSSAMVFLHKNINAQKLNMLMCNCQLAICPASGTCLEAAAVGMGIVSGYIADNQMGILEGLVRKGCVLNIGDFNKTSIEEIANRVEACIGNMQSINEMIKSQKKLIDGLSPQRFISIFNELCK